MAKLRNLIGTFKKLGYSSTNANDEKIIYLLNFFYLGGVNELPSHEICANVNIAKVKEMIQGNISASNQES